MEAALHYEVKLVSQLSNRSMNSVIVDALQTYLPAQRQALQQDLEATLKLLEQYAERDPDFDNAIDRVALAEANFDDPLEGTVVRLRDREPAVEADPVAEELEKVLSFA